MTLWHFYLNHLPCVISYSNFQNIQRKILFCIKTLEFSENVGLFYGFFLKNPAKIEVLTRKFQGLSMIQETAKVKNANFEAQNSGVWCITLLHSIHRNLERHRVRKIQQFLPLSKLIVLNRICKKID